MLKEQLVTTWSRIAQSPRWRRIISASILVFSIGFLGYKAFTSWDALKAYDWQIRYARLLPSFGLFVFQLLVITWGWRSIMDSLAGPLPFRHHIKVYGYTNLMRRVPAGVFWMIAGRAYAYKDQNISLRTSAVGSLLEFFFVVLTGLPLCAVAGWKLGFLSPVPAIALATATLALELVAIHPTVLSRLLKLARYGPLQAELTYSNTLCWAFIYTSIWLISGTGLFVIALLFIDLSVMSLPTTIGVWVLSSLVSYLTLFSPSGLGIKELSLTLLLSHLLPDPLPLLIALAIRVIWTVYDILIGVTVLML